MSTLPLLIILVVILFIGLYLSKDKRTPEQKNADEIDRLPVSDEIKEILKMSDEERKEKSRREAQEWMDCIRRNQISSALVRHQLYKSMYNISKEDMDEVLQNFFRRMGITRIDMIRLGFNPLLIDEQ